MIHGLSINVAEFPYMAYIPLHSTYTKGIGRAAIVAKPNRENFTAGRIAQFQFEPSKQGKLNQTFYWDGKTPGLGLRVTATGAKSYIFEAWLHGKSCRITIGDTRTWTVGQAQAEATRLKTLTDQGIDPREQKAEQRAKAEAKRAEAKRGAVLLSEAWQDYIEARKHKWSAVHLLTRHDNA